MNRGQGIVVRPNGKRIPDKITDEEIDQFLKWLEDEVVEGEDLQFDRGRKKNLGDGNFWHSNREVWEKNTEGY